MRGQDAVSVLKGVGEQREKRLHRLGIVTVEDLLTCRRMNLQPFWRR